MAGNQQPARKGNNRTSYASFLFEDHTGQPYVVLPNFRTAEGPAIGFTLPLLALGEGLHRHPLPNHDRKGFEVTKFELFRHPQKLTCPLGDVWVQASTMETRGGVCFVDQSEVRDWDGSDSGFGHAQFATLVVPGKENEMPTPVSSTTMWTGKPKGLRDLELAELEVVSQLPVSLMQMGNANTRKVLNVEIDGDGPQQERLYSFLLPVLEGKRIRFPGNMGLFYRLRENGAWPLSDRHSIRFGKIQDGWIYFSLDKGLCFVDAESGDLRKEDGQPASVVKYRLQDGELDVDSEEFVGFHRITGVKPKDPKITVDPGTQGSGKKHNHRGPRGNRPAQASNPAPGQAPKAPSQAAQESVVVDSQVTEPVVETPPVEVPVVQTSEEVAQANPNEEVATSEVATVDDSVVEEATELEAEDGEDDAESAEVETAEVDPELCDGNGEPLTGEALRKRKKQLKNQRRNQRRRGSKSGNEASEGESEGVGIEKLVAGLDTSKFNVLPSRRTPEGRKAAQRNAYERRVDQQVAALGLDADDIPETDTVQRYLESEGDSDATDSDTDAAVPADASTQQG